MRQFLTVFALALLPLGAQQQAPVPPSAQRVSPYAAAREQAIAPALLAMREGRNADALVLFESLMPQYPHDARMDMFASRAAHLSGDDVKALSYLQKTISMERPDHPIWGIHMEIVPLYAAKGDWDDFDRERTRIRDAAKMNPELMKLNPGYVVEEIHQDGKTITVTEYPVVYGRFHTRYRFVYPAGDDGTNWKPFIDCESDDIDQVAFAQRHAEQAQKGDRSFSLDGYPHPNTHATLAFFQDGEPTYETVRAAVLKNDAPLATTVRH